MYGMYVWYGMVWYGMYGKYAYELKGEFRRIWMTNRAPYNIVCLDYLVYLVYITIGSIGGNGSIRLPVVSVVMVVSRCCSIS